VTKRSTLWLALAMLLVAVRALPNINYPIFRDQATYCVVAQDLLHGAKLYRDVWDNKPPGVFWIYELIVKLFGPVMWSVGVIDILWLLAISYCIFRFAEHYVGMAGAAVAVVVNTEWHCRAGYEHAGQPEAFLILFVLAAYLQLGPEGRWALARHFAAGLLFGAAFWMKYNALIFLPLLVLIPYLDLNGLDSRPMRVKLLVPWRTWLKRTCALIVGWVSTIVGVLFYFWRAGLWRVLRESHFAPLARYGSFMLGRKNYGAIAVSTTVVRLGFSLFGLIVAFFIAHKRRELGRFVPVFAGAVLAFGVVVSQTTFLSHTFETCYPFFAMVWGYLAVKIFERWTSFDNGLLAPGWRLEQIVLRVITAALMLWALAAEGSTMVRRYRELRDWSRHPDEFYAHYPSPFESDYLEDQMGIIRLLNEKAAPRDGVYVWGHYPLIYYMTGLPPPTRFVTHIALAQGWGLPGWRQEFIGDLKKSPPAFVVVARKQVFPKPFPELDEFVSTYYSSFAPFPHFVVYRRKSPQ
jgi:hypothetical protein